MTRPRTKSRSNKVKQRTKSISDECLKKTNLNREPEPEKVLKNRTSPEAPKDTSVKTQSNKILLPKRNDETDILGKKSDSGSLKGFKKTNMDQRVEPDESLKTDKFSRHGISRSLAENI